ncbi:MAG: D-2-hydroxyacid dehydrogenase [Pseudomonadota bacterium]
MIVLSRGLLREQADEMVSGIDAEFVFAQDNRDDIWAAASDLDGIVNCPRALFDPPLLAKLQPRLKWVHNGGAGVETFMFPEFVNSGIVFTNGRIIQGPECSDHAMALLLALTRNLHLILRGKTAEMPRPIELLGKTAAVIGCGGIGLLTAEKLAAHGVKVIGIDEDYIPMVSFISKLHNVDNGLEILGECDFVVMAAPHTFRTARIMDAHAFSCMKRGSYFVNVSRGTTVDTDALVEALKSGHLAGAGLDVTSPEPLPADHPLRQMDNVIITPHSAGLSDFNRQRSLEVIRGNIKRFVAGQPLCNEVDKSRGY